MVEITLRIAQEEKASEWMLESESDLDKPVGLLVHDVEVAIELATKVDELRLNYNCDFDRRAYEAIRRSLLQLAESTKYRAAATRSMNGTHCWSDRAVSCPCCGCQRVHFCTRVCHNAGKASRHPGFRLGLLAAGQLALRAATRPTGLPARVAYD